MINNVAGSSEIIVKEVVKEFDIDYFHAFNGFFSYGAPGKYMNLTKINVVKHISRSFIEKKEYTSCTERIFTNQKYRQTALNEVQLGRAHISNHQYKTHLVFKESLK